MKEAGESVVNKFILGLLEEDVQKPTEPIPPYQK